MFASALGTWPQALRVALNSIRVSVVPTWEVIVSDDGGDDETERLIQKEFEWVRYIQGPRSGLGANRNRAVSSVTGTHVLFLDDDAAMSPDFLTQIMHLLRCLRGGRAKSPHCDRAGSLRGRVIFPE